MDDERTQASPVNLSLVRYDTRTGLVPVIVQDAQTKAVLTLAYANREALKRTLATGQTWFWSRSRQAYWRKGETSGNVQRVVSVVVDCDADAVLYLVNPTGPACHTGAPSCFYRTLEHSETVLEPREFRMDAPSSGTPALEPELSSAVSRLAIQGAAESDFSALQSLWSTVKSRDLERPEGSYTTYLFRHGAEKIGKKVGEEAVEVALAALRAELGGDTRPVVAESADLLYHLLVLWQCTGVSPEAVLAALQTRA